jgi:hypothetical protein
MKEFLPLGTVVQFRYQTLYEDGLPRFPAFFRKREDIVMCTVYNASLIHSFRHGKKCVRDKRKLLKRFKSQIQYYGQNWIAHR